MSTTTFSAGTVIASTWLNDVNNTVYGLALSTDANGDALVVVVRSDLSGAGASTQHEVNRSMPVMAEIGFGLVRGTGLSGATRTANGSAINAAIIAAKAIGSYVQLPAGPIEYDGTLNAQNGVVVKGHGNGGEIAGPLFLATSLRYYGNSYAVNMLGTSASVATRLQCTWSDLIVDATNAGGSSQGIHIGWNQRSNPLLRNVTILNTGHYGLNFADQNWNVSFDNVRIDTCGRTTANSSGIYKDPAVDSGTFNAITFNNLQVEGCGTSSSAAGGIRMETTTANRGLYFNDAIVEGNFGTDEIYITNMADLQFKNLYIERNNIVGQNIAVEVLGCKGSFIGGYITGENVANNLYGIKATTSELFIAGTSFATWGTAGIANFSSKITTSRNFGATFSGDSSAQWFGAYSPKFSAHKNGVDQAGIANATFTKVTFGTEVYDETNSFASSKDTPVAVSKRHYDAAVTFTTAVDQTRMIISLYRNGGVVKSCNYQASGTGSHTCRISTDLDVGTVTDYFEVYIRHDAGGTLTISGATDETYFSGHAISLA